jgi:hypothetical protein
VAYCEDGAGGQVVLVEARVRALDERNSALFDREEYSAHGCFLGLTRGRL